MWFSGNFAFAENLARSPRGHKRACKIAMQQLSPAALGEDLFAEATAFKRAIPLGWRRCHAKAPGIINSGIFSLRIELAASRFRQRGPRLGTVIVNKLRTRDC
jgi:hypothetical protein